MDCILHGVTKSWIRLSDFHSLLLVTVAASGASQVAQWNPPVNVGDARDTDSIPRSGRPLE